MKLPMSAQIRFSLPGKRVCFWGAPSDPPSDDGPDVPWQTRLQNTGGNTGNLFIGNGLFHHTDAKSKEYHPGFGVLPPSEFDNHFDCLMVPASNFVNPALDLESIYDYFRQTKTPIYCFGLGSQVIPGEPVVLKAGTENLLRLMSERSGSIGVRGAFTAEVLHSMGIRNVSLTGCPSLLGMTDTLLENLSNKRPTMEKVGANYSNNVRRHSFNPEAQRSTENGLFRHLMSKNSYYVLQNEASELALMELCKTAGAPIRRVLPTLCNIFEINSENELEFSNYLRSRLRVFYSVGPWIGAMRTMTATVGTRFHGNIASILGGTPGLVLVHDMRTLELAELFGIPHLVLDRPFRPEEIVDRLLAVDYGLFARRISLLRAEWRAFAVRNDIGVV